MTKSLKSKKRLIIKATGLVQGVFFRLEAQKQAKKIGLSGFVKNLPNGSIEIIAEGEEKDLHQFKKWCQKGPTYAEVKNIEAEWLSATGEFDDFEIKYEY